LRSILNGDMASKELLTREEETRLTTLPRDPRCPVPARP